MKKNKLHLFIVLISISLIANAQRKETDWNVLNLKGKVKSIERFNYRLLNGEMKKSYNNNFNTVFNNKGNLTRYKNYTCEYDNKGNKIKQTFYSSNKNIDYEFNWKYDVEGNKIKKDMHGRYIIYTYNIKKELIQETVYNTDGSLYQKSNYKYDGKGNKTEEKRFDSNNNLEDIATFKYDHNKNMIEKNSNNYLYKFQSKKKRTYNKKRELIKMISYELDGSIGYSRTYKYDMRGNLIEKKNYDSGIEAEKYTWVYDKEMNLITEAYHKSKKVKFESPNGDPNYNYSYEYKYDEKRNWTQKTKNENNKPTEIITRTLEYFE